MLPMVPIDQFREDNKSSLKMLKPWWDVFTDYLSIAMVLVAGLAGAMQTSKGNVYCLPTVECNPAMMNQSISAFGNTINCRIPLLSSAWPTSSQTVLLKLQNRGQYEFVNSVCSRVAFHWFTSYFSFIIFLEAVLLLMANNLCPKLPQSLSIMEHFVSMVNEGNKIAGTNLHVCNTLWDTDHSKYYYLDMSKEKNKSRSASASLDTAEPNKARSLQEKVKKFLVTQKKREKQKWFIKKFRWIYFFQSLLKCTLSVASVVFNFVFYNGMNVTVSCKLRYNFISEISENFECSYTLVSFFIGVFWVFVMFAVSHGILSTYTLIWATCIIKRKKYDFRKKHKDRGAVKLDEINPVERDVALKRGFGENKCSLSKTQKDNEAVYLGEIDPVTGDLSFLFHLLDKYNKLYSSRFAMFFSKTNEEKLRTYILAKDWPLERLERFCLDCGRTLLLKHLRGIPNTVFERTHLEQLILDTCRVPNDDFELDGWNKLYKLKSLSITNCGLEIIPEGVFKMKTLEHLDLCGNQVKAIPKDIQKLKALRRLNISNNKVSEGVQYLITMKNLAVNLQENPDLEFSRFCSDRKQFKCSKVHVDEQNITTQAKDYLGDRVCIDRHCLNEDTIDVVKYLPDQYPNIEQERTTDNVYHMTSYPKGLVLVIHLPCKKGLSTKDSSLLQSLFRQIGYKVQNKYENQGNDFEQFLRSDCKLAEETYDSLVIVWLGCCTQEGLYLEDGQTIITVKRITEILNGFANLTGKPKLVYIQACLHTDSTSEDGTSTEMPYQDRLDVEDSDATSNSDDVTEVLVQETISNELDLALSSNGENVTEAQDQEMFSDNVLLVPIDTSANDSYEVQDADEAIYNLAEQEMQAQECLPDYTLNVDRPTCDDVVVAVSTLQSHVSLQLKKTSWSVKALAEIFSQFACKEDVASLLRFVNCELSSKCILKENYKHVYSIESTLTKKWYLFPGYFGLQDVVIHETNV